VFSLDDGYGEMNSACLLVFLLEGQNAKQARTE